MANLKLIDISKSCFYCIQFLLRILNFIEYYTIYMYEQKYIGDETM